MVSAGISLSESLDALAAQTKNRKFSRLLQEIAARVKEGRPLSEAIAAHTKTFAPLVSFLVRAGEESGRLDDILLQLSDAMERRTALKQRIMTAVLYPATVISVALIVMVVLVAVIVPQFETVFANLNAEIPALTRRAFHLGRFVHDRFRLLTAIFLSLLFAVFLCAKSRRGKIFLDRMLLALPLFGDICRKASYARSFSVMGLMLSSGVGIAEALALAGMTASNEIIQKDFLAVREEVIMGVPIHAAISKEARFDPMVQQMIAVGEETGRVENMFAKLAVWYSRELSEKVKRLTVLMEPFVILLVGIVVAFMAFTIFLPIVSSIQNLI